MKMPKVLIISHNEICYNARLLKAADVFQSEGWDVDVFNAVTGIAPADVYQEIIQNREWNVIENDISRRSLSSKLKWLVNGLLFKVVKISIEKLNSKAFNSYYLNKGLILRPTLHNKKYDLIIVHLIDNLPFAAKLKKETGAKLIYDSQEYFVGQYATFKKSEFEWVKENEKKYIKDVDILLSTTHVMLNRILEDYDLKIPAFRVRNVPSLNSKVKLNLPADSESKDELKLIWHGMAIYFNNRRGVHILLQAVAQCKQNVKLYLQGNFPDDQKKMFESYCENYPLLKNKVEILPSAKPDQIIQSLLKYDVGLTGELPEEENQELTSSNKLFDYINAGLAVVSSDVLGLSETIDEFKVGYKYKPGNVDELSLLIDNLAIDRSSLKRLKNNSIEAAKELYWENDYKKVMEVLKK